jgi:MFS family permease
MLISRAAGFFETMTLYMATGIGSGLANVPMMGLVSHWFLKTTRGRAAGAMLSGNGIAIVLTGMFIPWLNSEFGAQGWRTGWLTIGIISIFIAGVAAFFLRNNPKEKGLEPLGSNDKTAMPDTKTIEPKKNSKWTMIHLGSIYTFFGATYAVYVTFIVTAMVNERGFGEGAAGKFWAVVGALSIFSGPLFGWISDKLGRKTAMMIVYGLFTIAYGLVAANLPNSFLYASIGIFGLSVWSIPTIMSAAVGDYVGPAKAVTALGFITLFFGAGQITGPALAGFLADTTGTFSMAFWLCALLTGIAVVVTYFLKVPSKN